MSSARRIPVYRGHFGPEQAERLLWRAGFGPRPGEEKRLAKKGLHGAVHSLTHPPRDRLIGPKPVDDDGHPIAPIDAWGHDHLWWLDRMVRSNRPLVERMTLVWHDWFATSNAGVGSQRLMLQQNGLFRSHGLGSFYQLLLAVTRDPAMLLWLNGTDNEKDAPNENYGREMMELFTLGASRGYSERDVREQARALTGWRNDWRRRQGPGQLPLRPAAPRHRHEEDLRQARPLRLAGLLPARRPPPEARVVLRREALELLRPDRRLRPRPAARSRALYVRNHYAIRPVVEAILKHPLLYNGPRMVKPPVVYLAGMLRARRRGIDTEAWTWLSNQAGQQLFYPPNVAGWDDTRWLDTASFLARWNLAGRVLRPSVLKGDDKAPLNAEKLLDRALAFWGRPRLTPPTQARAEVVRPPRDQRRRPEVEEGAVPAADRERAAPPDRRLPGPADQLMPHHDCTEHSRSALLRKAVAQAGAGLPDIEPGMPLPAGTGLDRRSFIARSVGLAVAVYGATALTPRALDHGIAQALAAGPAGHGARHGLPRRRHRLAVRPLPVRRSRVPPAAPEARARRTRGSSSRRTRACAGIRPPPAFHTLHAEGKLAVLPGRRVHERRPVALHVAPLLGGRRHRSAAPDRLARPLPRPRRQGRQPAPGREPRRRALALARDGEEAGRGAERRRATTRSGRRASTARSRTACSSAIGALGSLARPRQGARAARGRSPSSRTACASSSRPSTADSSRRSRTRSRTTASRIRWPASPRCSPPGLPLHCVALSANGGYDTHSDQAQDLSDNLDLASKTLLAFQRDLEARGLAEPRADARLVGVRPPRRGERLRRHRPRRRRASASSWARACAGR